ncbi:MAG TPA: hypothetical protein VF503_25845 [Sphingobium sp.]|uniref:hypothetical protein n=1 Tax=Sphingobium sp. TaxID=1912891 RepID=UPI002ED63A97
MKKFTAGAAMTLILIASAAEAQGRFGGGARMRGGSLHAGGGAPMNFRGPGSGGGGIQHPVPPGPHPGPGPGPHPGPGPGPGPHPGPGPGPGPGPHPPGPPGPPPPPPPAGWGYGWGWDDDPYWDFAAGAMIAGTTAAVVSAASQPDVVVVQSAPTIGTVVYALPPNCPQVIRAGETYYSCANTWYLPQYLSSGVTYLIVSPP